MRCEHCRKSGNPQTDYILIKIFVAPRQQEFQCSESNYPISKERFILRQEVAGTSAKRPKYEDLPVTHD